MITSPDWIRRLRSGGLRLRRSWPRSPDHLLLELVDPAGRRTAGQWFADSDRAAMIVAATPGARLDGGVVLQPGGADRRLPTVGPLVARTGGRLVSHRPERRAVVASGSGYLKTVRPSAYDPMLRRARLTASLDLGAPQVLSADQQTASMITETLPGRPLSALLGTTQSVSSCAAVGRWLARLHGLPPETVTDTDLRRHGPVEETGVLRRWTGLAAAYGLQREPSEVPALPPTRTDRVIHRDFHDGQVIMNGDRPGVLDFDLLALGDPALDLANFLAHLELRAEQGVLADVASATAATLEAYGPDAAVRAALPSYLAIARMRLRAVYAFRDAELVS